MELKFLGRGASFNPKEGNTSAYFIENNQLFLIDCGESVFERLFERGLLESTESIYLMITHTHSDHIGSIGSLAMYCFYKLRRPLNIILPEKPKHKIHIENILNSFGCAEQMFNYIDETSFDEKYKTFRYIRYVETNHCNNLTCYGLIFSTKNGIVYYSGDTSDVTNIEALISASEPIDKIYVDITTEDFPGNPHLYIEILARAIPEELKSRIYCMHFNKDECLEQAKLLGFNVVENEDKKDSVKIKELANKEE